MGIMYQIRNVILSNIWKKRHEYKWNICEFHVDS